MLFEWFDTNVPPNRMQQTIAFTAKSMIPVISFVILAIQRCLTARQSWIIVGI